jgi:FKBP-type peptidyl-prolyl cis-trans isomerase
MRSAWSAWIPAVLFTAALAACSKDPAKGSKLNPDDSKAGTLAAGSGSGAGSARTPNRPGKARQITPPFDTQAPPADATKTDSGLAFKKMVEVNDGKSPGKNDIVKVSYTGWKATGETMYSTADKGGAPLQMAMQSIPPGFAEALKHLKVGEKAMLWIPAEIGYRDIAKPPKPEAMCYEVELVDITPALPVPEDVAKPPADAAKTALGNAKKVLTPGKGEKPRNVDSTTFNVTVWDAEGNQLETTESGGTKRPQNQPPFRQSKGLEDVLLSMQVGEVSRFWVPQDQLTFREKPRAPGVCTLDVELVSVDKSDVAAPAVPKDVAGPPPDAQKTERGTFYKILKKKPGGKQPVATDTVSVNYSGWTTDGRLFDSSLLKGKPAEFPLKGVIQGWTDGIPQMRVGETARFWIPVELAYQGRAGKPAGMLVFDVDLLEIKPAAAAPSAPAGQPETPPDVASPPKDAKKTDKGVFYKVLAPAKNPGKQPTADNTVVVHYSGWTTDGKLFDSSLMRGSPAEFPLAGVIPGWTDGLQQMKTGDKFRFWIPVELAYNNKPGMPAGMLVFDVELLEVK